MVEIDGEEPVRDQWPTGDCVVEHREYKFHAWHRSEDIPRNGRRASSLSTNRCEMGNSKGRVKPRTCFATFPDTARPFLSDRECSLRISPINGVDGILNVKPMKANSWQRGWSYVGVMDVKVVEVVVDVKVVEVVVEDEERRWCSANTRPPFIRFPAGWG
jgi:hypothetical protein